MTKSILVVRSMAGFLWLAQLVLGVAFWTGHGWALVPVHMALGVGFVLALWVLAALCARAGAPIGGAVLLMTWGAVVAGLGFTQSQLLTGSSHWVIRVIHLLLGLGAMPIAGRLSLATRRGEGPPVAAAAASPMRR